MRSINLNTNSYLLYLITDRTDLDEKYFLEIIEQECRGGVTMVQLREKFISDKDFIRLGHLVKSILKKYDIPFILNDRYHLVLELNADGVHLGQSDFDPIEVRKIIGPSKIIGISLETIEDITHVKQNKMLLENVNYVALSPVFYTSTKKDIKTSMGLNGLLLIKKEIPTHPLIAIGGINESNIKSVISFGADGIALVSSIMFADNPQNKTKQLKEIIYESISKST